MDKLYTVQFNQQEIVILRNMINVAVMAKGLEAAEAGLIFDRKLTEAVMAVEQAVIVKKDNIPQQMPPHVASNITKTVVEKQMKNGKQQ